MARRFRAARTAEPGAGRHGRAARAAGVGQPDAAALAEAGAERILLLAARAVHARSACSSTISTVRIVSLTGACSDVKIDSHGVCIGTGDSIYPCEGHPSCPPAPPSDEVE